jgi:FdhD protein
MNVANEFPKAIRHQRARRISTADAETRSSEESVGVVLEAPLTIDIGGGSSYTVLCTPAEEGALALGFLRTEGIIDTKDDVDMVAPCPNRPNVLRVKLKPNRRPSGSNKRNLLITSSCGACGSEDLQAKLDALSPVGDTLRVDGTLLRSVSHALRRQQILFEFCGGTHASAIFDGDGEILAVAEDVGRHNALDKAIGKCLLLGIPTAGRGVMLSGRVSTELVSKCARVGIELIAAVSAPTSLAIDVAGRCNLTLCDFVRDVRATVFTHPGRVIGS